MLVAVVAVSLVSLVGVSTLAINKTALKRTLLFLVAFSAGALIGDSFLHLLPEAMELGRGGMFVSVSIFSGIIAFFILEKILRFRHCHDISCHDHPRHLGTMNLVGDAMHNLIDGILIGTSFAVSLPLGISTTIAVILHEIPQELGDFGILLHSGFTVKKAVLWNLLSASFAILAAVGAYFIGNRADDFTLFMIPFTIGTFMYIAMSDLIPELHKETTARQTLAQLFGLSLGMGMMFLLLFME